ncbi:MAG: patatin-like phospholipase family protein [Bacteroidota bacterium]
MRFSLIFISFLITEACLSQKVGVVLSGGGAKGMAHVGVLKALEENEIPVDYIIGTSMGGIVGGLYACGYTPYEMEQIFTSDRFQNWMSGRPSNFYNYYFKRREDDASWVSVKLSLDSALQLGLKSNLANDLAINFELEEKLSPLAANANNNFDSLFIPYRAMAADIFTQSEVVLDSGRLSEAVRATFSVPFFYRPIRVNGQLLFDGGLYNNFPVDVAEEEFDPDVIIAVNVSNKKQQTYPFEEDEKLLSESLILLLLDKTDTTKVGINDIYIEPNMTEFSSLSFVDAQSIIDSGYYSGLRKLTELKEKISRRIPCDDLAEKRLAYGLDAPKLDFDKLIISGFKPKQDAFIRKTFKNKGSNLSIPTVKDGYFDLTSEAYFSSIYPKIKYNDSTNLFDLEVVGKSRTDLDVSFGGNIATRSISELFLGLEFRRLGRWLNVYNVNFYTGRFYQSASVSNRIVFPSRSKFFIRPYFTYNEWDYIDSGDLLVDDNEPTIIRQFDRKSGISIGLPAGKRSRVEVGAAYFNNNDFYENTKTFFSTDTLDELKFEGARFGAYYDRNSLNRKQYASEGSFLSVGFDYILGEERYFPGSTSNIQEAGRIVDYHNWFRLKFRIEQYFSKTKFKVGYMAESVLSNQPLFSNFKGSLISAPQFNPLQDSKTLFLQNFRAYNYVAGGGKIIWEIFKNIDLRVEGYVFKPLERLTETMPESQQPTRVNELTRFNIAGATTAVYHTAVGPIALSFNYYDDSQNEFGLLLHLGYILFNKRSLE